MKVEKKFIYLMVLVVVWGAALLFLLLPAYQNSLQLEKEISQTQAEYASQAVSATNLQALLAEVASRQDDLAKVNQALPIGFDLGSVVHFLQQQGQQSGLTVESAQLQQSSAPGSPAAGAVKTATLQVTLSGSYPQLKSFLAALESSARLFSAQSIALSAATNTQGKPSNEMKLEIQTYYY